MEDYNIYSTSQTPPTTDTTTDTTIDTTIDTTYTPGIIFDMYGFHTPDSQDNSDMIFNYENDSNFTSNYQNHSNIISIYQSYSYTFIISVVIYIIFALGLPSILMAIYSLYSMVRSDHVAPIYVINLLITDLIQLCYMIVPVVSNVNRTIRIISSIYLSGLVASVYFMVCIALERYLVIVHPLWYRCRRTIKSSVVVCVLVWVLSLVYGVLYYFIAAYVVRYIIFAVLLLLPFPLFIFFLTGTLKALSASISVPSDEKRRIVGVLVLVLLIYTLLFLPRIILNLDVNSNVTLAHLSLIFVRFSPLADLFLYVFMRKGFIDKLLASVCCCRMDSKEISSSSV